MLSLLTTSTKTPSTKKELEHQRGLGTRRHSQKEFSNTANIATDLLLDLVGVVKCISYAAMQLCSYAAMQLCSFVSSLQIECKKLAASGSLEAVPDTHAPVL